MAPQMLQASAFWSLVRRQRGVISRRQLLDLGISADAIKHWIRKCILHPVWRGVYAVGRPDLSREGRWLAALLTCGDGALLSHGSAAALWGLEGHELRAVELTVPPHRRHRRSGIRLYRKLADEERDRSKHRGIPVTSPCRTLVDLSQRLSRARLETAVNEADTLGLVSPPDLRTALDAYSGRSGIAKLRAILDRRTFRLTDSHLERLFLPLAKRAGLPPPQTRVQLNGFRVDFYWAHLGLVVETDGLRYHRTPAQQARDRLRDQTHVAAGLTPLRFTHEQVRYEPTHVERVLRQVANRLSADA